MSQLVENTYLAYNQFLEGELNQYDLMSLVEEGIISGDLLDSIMEEALSELEESELAYEDEDYYDELEEGKLWSQWRAHRNDLKREIAVNKKDVNSARTYGERALSSGSNVVNILNKRKQVNDESLRKNTLNFTNPNNNRLDNIRNNVSYARNAAKGWLLNRQLNKHNALQALRQKKVNNTETDVEKVKDKEYNSFFSLSPFARKK